MVLFGQIVVGPPGAGKTTYSNGMQQFCAALHRPCVIINLDPANDELPYDCQTDIRDLITVDSAMNEYNLGPNGALMFCMEYLLTNFDWLEDKLANQYKDYYVVFDCPGQVELYTHNKAMLGIIQQLHKTLDARLTVVHLVDSVLCTEPSKFISALLVSLSCQLLLELPHVNVLTKIDLLKHHSKELAFKLEYYAEVQDLQYLLQSLDDLLITPSHPFDRKYRKLNDELCNLIEDFKFVIVVFGSLVGFLPLDIQNKENVLRVVQQIDTANGYSLSAQSEDPLGLFKLAIGPLIGLNEEIFGSIQEHQIDVESNEESDLIDGEEREKLISEVDNSMRT